MHAKQLVEDEFIFEPGSKAMGKVIKSHDLTKVFGYRKGWTRPELIKWLVKQVNPQRNERLTPAEVERLMATASDKDLENLAEYRYEPFSANWEIEAWDDLKEKILTAADEVTCGLLGATRPIDYYG